MFSDIARNSTMRITEVRESLDFISSLIPPPPVATPRHINTAKGLIFVQLYGVIEYTINNAVAKAIFYINLEAPKLLDIKILIWSLALNPQLDSLIQANKKKWDKRRELFQKVSENECIPIITDLMPTNGDNFTVLQLQSILNTFHITEPVFPNPSFRGRLQEIVSNRINIAHGNISPADVGSAVTSKDLQDRIHEVSEFCSYFIALFEDYIKNKRYMK